MGEDLPPCGEEGRHIRAGGHAVSDFVLGRNAVRGLCEGMGRAGGVVGGGFRNRQPGIDGGVGRASDVGSRKDEVDA